MLLPFHDGRCSGNEKKYNNSRQSNLQSCEARQSRGQQGQSHVIIIVVIVVIVIATIAVVATVIVIPLRRHWLPRGHRCGLAPPVPRVGADIARGASQPTDPHVVPSYMGR